MRRFAAAMRVGLACGFVLLGLGCGGEREARWLELERVQPALLESGGTLRVEGSGLVAGRRCEVRFTGRSHRPGLPPVEVSAVWPARAVSASEVLLPLTAELLGRLGGHGSFEGVLTLAFEARGGEGAVTGALPVRLDVSLPLARGVRHEQSLRERSRALLAFAGIVAAEEASVHAGLVVQSVLSGSRGEAAGLRQGDVIARAGDVTVHALSDLAPPPGARDLSLMLSRPGQRKELRVSLPLLGLHAPDVSAELARLSVLLTWTLCCTLLLWPSRGFARWFVRAFDRARRAPDAELGLWGGALPEPREGSRSARAVQALRSACWPALLSLAGVLLVWLEPAGFLAVRSISIYLALAAVSATLTLLSDAGSAADRRRAAAGAAGRMLVMGVLIACACALSGTRAFDGMVLGQGPWPPRWALFQKPALLCAFPLYVVFAARLGASTLALEPRGRAAQWLVAERVLTNVVLCALGVAIFAGGWQSPDEIFVDGLDPRLLGALMFVLKAWAFAWLLSLARRVGLGDGVRRRAVAALCGAAVALTGLWLWLEPSAAVELALGRALSTTAAVVVLTAIVRARSASLAPQAPAAAPAALPAGTAS
jgi:hypothetical protein